MVGRNGYVPWCSLVVLVPPPSLLHLTQVPTRTTALPRSQHHSVHGHLSQDLLPQSKSSALGEETNNTKKPTHKKTHTQKKPHTKKSTTKKSTTKNYPPTKKTPTTKFIYTPSKLNHTAKSLQGFVLI